jgi:hypothetical protein
MLRRMSGPYMSGAADVQDGVGLAGLAGGLGFGFGHLHGDQLVAALHGRQLRADGLLQRLVLLRGAHGRHDRRAQPRQEVGVAAACARVALPALRAWRSRLARPAQP